MKMVSLTFAILISRVLTAFAMDVNPQANPDHRSKLVVTPANLNLFTCSSEGLPAPTPASQTLQIRGVPNPRVHDGDGDRARKDSLEWTAIPSEDWIHIEPAAGFTPDETVVSVDPAGLAVGEYAGEIEFNTPGQKKPRIVQIKLRIQTAAAANFTLNPAAIGFTGETNSNITLIDSVHLGVIGADHLDFTATNSQSWLQVAPGQATAPITVLLLASVDSFPPGTYYDTVLFRGASGGGSAENGEDHCLLDSPVASLPVSLTVTPQGQPPLLVVTPGRLGFAALFGGSNPQPQNLSVSTPGNASTPWTAGASQSWLQTSPANGIARKIPDTVQASVNITGLNPGLYTDTITFSSPAGEVKIPVFLQIFPPSELTDSVAIGDGVVDLTDLQINRFSVPVFASNTQAVCEILLPLHFEDGQTTLDSVTFSDRVDYANIKEFLRLATPGHFRIRIRFFATPDLPPGEGVICWLHFITTGVLPQFADTLEIDSSASVMYLVTSDGNDLIVNPAFKKGRVILRNLQVPTSADDGDGNRPIRFGLNQNYPNPFNPQTAIAFSLPKSSEVKLEVFDLLGRSVVTLTEGQMTAGRHTIVWDGRDRSGRTVSSGLYLYRLQAGSFVETKKMLFLK